jgi:hypothetical protein
MHLDAQHKLVLRRDAPRESTTWPELLAAATTLEAVMEVARDYLARIEPLEHATLPPGCKPPARFQEPGEIVNLAFMMVQAHAGPHSDNETLFRMANFFSHATRRVAELTRPARGDEEANAKP